jgi:hypothetical protein
MGHRPGVKGGYFPVPPVDSFQDMRSEMCLISSSWASGRSAPPRSGRPGPVRNRHQVFSTLVQRADWLQIRST